MEALAPGLKTIENATEIRSRLLLALSGPEREQNAEERRAWLNFVIVGGGPLVELAGALGEIANDTLRHDFRRINPREGRDHGRSGGRAARIAHLAGGSSANGRAARLASRSVCGPAPGARVTRRSTRAV